MPEEMYVSASRVETAKVVAAQEACKFVSSLGKDIKVLGLGTGSTVKLFIDSCLHLIRGFKVVASSPDTVLYVKERGLETVDVLSVNNVDVYVDGADEVSSKLDLVKGRGGALLREKTLAYLSELRLYVVDYTKYTGVDYLYAKPIPIEVVPTTLNYVLKAISKTDFFTPVLRAGGGKDGPVITDNGNYIVDLKPLRPVKDPRETHYELKSIHGVVETGIFPSSELVDVVIIGYEETAVVMRRR